MKDIQIGDLVAMNRLPDAAIYRVIEHTRFTVVMVDASQAPGTQAPQLADISTCRRPTKAQLGTFLVNPPQWVADLTERVTHYETMRKLSLDEYAALAAYS